MLYVRDWCSSDDHPKLLEAGFWGACVWRQLIRLSRKHGLAGTVPASFCAPDYLARIMGLDHVGGDLFTTPAAAVRQGLEAATAARLLHRPDAEGNVDCPACAAFLAGVAVPPGGLVIHDWGDWQPPQPMTDAERQRKSRAAKKAADAAQLPLPTPKPRAAKKPRAAAAATTEVKAEGTIRRAWIQAAADLFAVVSEEAGFTAPATRMVITWARDMNVARGPLDQLGPRELLRRWWAFLCDGDPFTEKNRTLAYFLSRSEQWQGKLAKPRDLPLHSAPQLVARRDALLVEGDRLQLAWDARAAAAEESSSRPA